MPNNPYPLKGGKAYILQNVLYFQFDYFIGVDR